MVHHFDQIYSLNLPGSTIRIDLQIKPGLGMHPVGEYLFLLSHFIVPFFIVLLEHALQV